MKIDPKDILWSSRGRDWGFQILRHPTIFECEWLDVYKEVFGNSKDDEGFYLRTQVWIGQSKKVECIGIRFLDPELRCDSAGRVIPHEFIVFGQTSSFLEDNTDWVHWLWPIVSEEYAILYPMNSREVQKRFLPYGIVKNGGFKPPGKIRLILFLTLFLITVVFLATALYSHFCLPRFD